MKIKLLAIAVSGLALLVATTASAKTRHHPRAEHPRIYDQPALAASPHSDQPHMVEIRPGLWISSWDCVQNEGQGRLTPCNIGNAGRGP